MEIKCTSIEKDILIVAIVDSVFCPFKFRHCSEEKFCEDCIKKHIKWKIKEGDK